MTLKNFAVISFFLAHFHIRKFSFYRANGQHKTWHTVMQTVNLYGQYGWRLSVFFAQKNKWHSNSFECTKMIRNWKKAITKWIQTLRLPETRGMSNEIMNNTLWQLEIRNFYNIYLAAIIKSPEWIKHLHEHFPFVK